MKLLLAFSCAVLALGAAPSARAASQRDPGATGGARVTWLRDDTQAAPTESRREWYGYTTALADVASLAVIGLGARFDSHRANTGELYGWLYGVGGVGLVLGAPAVHFAAGEGGTWGKSLALRIFGPLGGAAIGYVAAAATDSHCHETHEENPNSHWNCESAKAVGAIGGGFFGGVSAMVVDHAWLAWRPAPPPKNELSWSIAPLIDEQRVGGVVTGSF